jgi:hypothetical protein
LFDNQFIVPCVHIAKRAESFATGAASQWLLLLLPAWLQASGDTAL